MKWGEIWSLYWGAQSISGAMTPAEFVAIAQDFEECGLVVISGKDIERIREVACAAKASLEAEGRNAIVYDETTLVTYTRDNYTGNNLDPWGPERRYRPGEFIIPTALESDYIIFRHGEEVDCAVGTVPRLRYRCMNRGVSSRVEPSWPLVLNETVIDRNITWKASTFQWTASTHGNESGLLWELISLWCRNECVVFAPKYFDPAFGLTGDVINDVVWDALDVNDPRPRFRGQEFNPYEHVFYRQTRRSFPFARAFFYYDTDADTIELFKIHVTHDGCDWPLPVPPKPQPGLPFVTWCDLTVDQWCNLSVQGWCDMRVS
jgi:hypothetical protein